jgi:hypothetical protein
MLATVESEALEPSDGACGPACLSHVGASALLLPARDPAREEVEGDDARRRDMETADGKGSDGAEEAKEAAAAAARDGMKAAEWQEATRASTLRSAATDWASSCTTRSGGRRTRKLRSPGWTCVV